MTKVTIMTIDSAAASHHDNPHLVWVNRMMSPMALKQARPRRQPTLMLPEEVIFIFKSKIHIFV